MAPLFRHPFDRSRVISSDIATLFATRVVRLFAYGFLSIILALHLSKIGLSETQIGLLFTIALAGDALISLWITTSADRHGRRRMLILGSLLMILAGVIFAFSSSFPVLCLAGLLGILSPSGGEIGPFLSIEQAALSQLVTDSRRTSVFAWYSLCGSLAAALGALSGGWFVEILQTSGLSVMKSYQTMLLAYSFCASLIAILFWRLSIKTEAPAVSEGKRVLGLHSSQKIVFKLSSLFALDAFAGGLIIQSMLAYWFYVRFAADVGTLGSIFFGVNLLGGLSALLAAALARRFGLINTMVFTHIPSNLLLILIPFMPNLGLAVALLLLRSCISQMDVPTRQSYTMAVVKPDERSAAAGITTISRSIGSASSPVLTGWLMSSPVLIGLPFILSGFLKIVYDLSLYFSFRSLKAPEETL